MSKFKYGTISGDPYVLSPEEEAELDAEIEAELKEEEIIEKAVEVAIAPVVAQMEAIDQGLVCQAEDCTGIIAEIEEGIYQCPDCGDKYAANEG